MNRFSGEAKIVVQAQHVHGGVHAGRRPWPVPRGIPIPPWDFTDRDDPLRWLRERCAEAAVGIRTLVITGPPGIGKTLLARALAKMEQGRFPGGSLMVRGAAHERGEPGLFSMLGALLERLGVADRHQPEDVEGRRDLYRSMTSEDPCLVLLDGVSEALHIRELAPNAPGSVVLVTASRSLRGLQLDGAEHLELRELDPEHSGLLFAKVAGDPHREAAHLVRFCEGHPHALRLLGSQVRDLHETSIVEFAAQMEDERRRLRALSPSRGTGVSASFTVVYRRLDPGARRLYRLLTLLPGPHFTADRVAALADTSMTEARRALGVLADAHLLRREPGGRFAFSGLVRVHAAGLAAGDAPEERRAALARAVRHDVRKAAFADRRLMGERQRAASHAELLTGAVDPFADRREAVAWLRAERANLPALMRAAQGVGLHTEVWQLAEALVAFYLNHRYLAEWATVCELGLAAARATGARRAEARLRLAASRVFMTRGEPDLAWAETERAAALAAADADQVGRAPRDLALAASVWEHRGRVLRERDPAAALAAFGTSRELNERAGERRGRALALLFGADPLVSLGRPGEARSQVEEALAGFRALGDDRMAARALIALARLLLRLGERREAAALLDAALMELGGTHYEAEARELLAALARDGADAEAHLRAALKVYADEGHPRARELSALLEAPRPGRNRAGRG
ncbi:ATP-binding protein [Actinocorallia sp. API 0066]|uniref:NB-ARC domain-containing protein n=1 Tax=Actinocorallia sp. API 0066 TaxID=2896846 RepID=UPI001E3D5A92|nr:NB-ARC domain-containing protein [Actinocorallia sp. API 0066]MCD0449700.1 ATP-binding protein [Actinocorallia sp. API 0066]